MAISSRRKMRQDSTPVIHNEGKIDIHGRTEKLQRQLAHLEQDPTVIPDNLVIIQRFIKDCMLGKTIKGKAKKKIGAGRCLKYLGILKNLSLWFGKPFEGIDETDMESFVQRLEADQILSVHGRSYSDSTKTDIKKSIKKFWKWKDGENKFYPKLVDWLDTCDPVKDVPAFTRQEVERMIEGTASIRDRALVMVLFDSGARVEELLNVRLKKEHLFWNASLNCYLVRLEFSKTKPRTISLPLSTKHLSRWLEVHPAAGNPQSQLFPMTYPALKMVVKRLGQKALNKRATPHMLRHSSATYYANRLKNPYKLCYRYGWTMASNMVNRYLDREGILEEETAESIRTDELSKAEKRTSELGEVISHLKEDQESLLKEQDSLKQELSDLKSGKGILRLLLSVMRKSNLQRDALFQAISQCDLTATKSARPLDA
jgi:integrase